MDRCACGGALEEGFIPDFAQQAVWATTWIKGEPDQGKSIKEIMLTGAGIKANGADVRVVEALRCTSCGRLDLYARDKPHPSTTPARAR